MAAKPLTTQFVKRQPRLTKPLELRKRPRPRQRLLHREMISVKARAGRQPRGDWLEGAQMAGRLAQPRVAVARARADHGAEMEPQSLAEPVHGARERESKMDMALEMVDVEALDTGRYRAIVVQDPADKRVIKGFLHLGLVYLESMFVKHADIAQLNVLEYIRKVVDAMNKYTQIETDLRGRYTFDSAELLKTPWVFMNTNRAVFRLARSEAANLGTYLTTGGFFYIETDCAHPWDGPGHPDGIWRRQELVSGRNMLKDALASVGYRHGQDWVFERLPNQHPLYSCYFDFDGPPVSYWPRHVPTEDVIHGITIDSRLIMIFETGDYERFVNDTGGRDGTRHRQFLVNVVVFALTQEGSMTHRLMNMVNY